LAARNLTVSLGLNSNESGSWSVSVLILFLYWEVAPRFARRWRGEG
jgi:hypothetical protein